MDEDLLPVIGWREWVGLPELGVPACKAKIDTGARSSAIHAVDLRRVGRDHVRFRVAPARWGGQDPPVVELPLLEIRSVRSSNGLKEDRYFVKTEVELLGRSWHIELTLAERDRMRFRMLLGREAIRGRFLVDPGRSFVDPARRPRGQRSSRWATPPEGGDPR